MNYLLSIILAVFTQTTDVDLIKKAEECAGENADISLFQKMLDFETQNHVPVEFRGFSLAAACQESSFSNDRVGDHGKAKGIFQFHHWAERHIDSPLKIKRLDKEASAKLWIQRVTHRMHQNPCGFDSESKRFVNAWVRAIRSPKGARCNQWPKHLTTLAEWKKEIAADKTMLTVSD